MFIETTNAIETTGTVTDIRPLPTTVVTPDVAAMPIGSATKSHPDSTIKDDNDNQCTCEHVHWFARVAYYVSRAFWALVFVAGMTAAVVGFGYAITHAETDETTRFKACVAAAPEQAAQCAEAVK